MRFLVLAALLFPAAASAQFGVSSVADPIRPVRAPLAHADEVPDVFLLGLGGSTAALVNPARAARLRGRFVYGTIRPQGTPEPVSFAGLAGTRDRRWLLVADNAIRTQETDDFLMETVTSPNGVESERSDRTEASNTASLTRLRLLHVGRTDFGGYAVGLYGGYRGDDDNLTRIDDFSSDDPEPPRTGELSQRTEQRRRLQHDDFAVGAEAAFAGETWDLAAAASYQRRTADAALTSLSSFQNDIRDAGTTILDQREQSIVQSLEGTPEAVDFEVIGALRAGRKRDDYLYGAVRGTFGSGTADYRSTSESERLFIRTVDGEVVERDESSSETADEGTIDLDTRDVRVSLGYVYARHGRGVTVLAALNPTAAFGRTERATADGSPFFAAEETDERTEIALTLPLYVSFDVTKRLEAFGGGVYTYAYRRSETERRPRLPVELDESATLELTRGRTTDSFFSDSRLYAGALFTFRSGLEAQASLRGNLADVAGWTVSLGYRF